MTKGIQPLARWRRGGRYLCLSIGLVISAAMPLNGFANQSDVDLPVPRLDDPGWADGKADIEMGAAMADRLCARCHGATGISYSPNIPNLAGQRQIYLVTQMKTLRKSRKVDAAETMDIAHRYRRHPSMSNRVGGLSDDEIFSLAIFYSKQACAPAQGQAPVIDITTLAQCAKCHSDDDNFESLFAPVLNAQNKTYLARQLVLFRDSAYLSVYSDSKTFRYHHRMAKIAARMNNHDIEALSTYYAANECVKPDQANGLNDEKTRLATSDYNDNNYN